YPAVSWLAVQADQVRIHALVELVRQGEVAKVIPRAQALEAKKDLPGFAFYNLGCVYALAAHPPPSDSAQSDAYARRALACLRQAENRGHFQNRSNVEHTKKDADLDSLRRRDDFKQWLKAVEEKVSNSAPRPPSP